MAQHWDKGVDLELNGIGRYQNVTSTEEAGRHLLERWPKQDGPAFKSAIKAITEALTQTRNRALAEKARTAFIKAAEDADIYIRSK
jgi:hypothetical protein